MLRHEIESGILSISQERQRKYACVYLGCNNLKAIVNRKNQNIKCIYTEIYRSHTVMDKIIYELENAYGEHFFVLFDEKIKYMCQIHLIKFMKSLLILLFARKMKKDYVYVNDNDIKGTAVMRISDFKVSKFYKKLLPIADNYALVQETEDGAEAILRLSDFSVASFN